VSTAPANNDDYRRRVYKTYVTGRTLVLAPSVIGGLRPRAAQLNKLIRDHFPADRSAKIADLGCGHGALIYFAQRAGYCNIEGIDGSAQQVAAARHLGIAEVREGDLGEVLSSMADSSHDVLVTFDVIEHFRKDELVAFVDGALRVLRPGGRWIIHTPNAESPFGCRMRYWDFTHEMAFTRESISQLLFSSGFTVVSCYEDGPVPHGVASTVRWLLWRVIRAMLRLWLAIETGDGGRQAIFSQNLLVVAFKQQRV
jgi:2-polyprenyl-3-methyl-5-hydroxy-6-metoxy-1,4-benzoquinol methylase